MKVSPLLLGGGGLLALGLLVLLSSGAGSRQITDPSELGAIQGDRFVVLVYNPSTDDADPMVADFLALDSGGAQLLAVPFGIIQRWGQLSDAVIESRVTIVAVNAPEDRVEQFAVPDTAEGLASVVAQAVAFTRTRGASGG